MSDAPKIMRTSRKESNFISSMSSNDRERYLKRFIASCNIEQLIPFIEIKKHSENFREIEYEIKVPVHSVDGGYALKPEEKENNR